MKTVGYLLLSAGFLGGSLVAVQTATNYVDWKWFLPLLLLAIVGVALARASNAMGAYHEEVSSLNIGTLNSSMATITDNMRRLREQVNELHPYEVHRRIDSLFPADINAFVEARESLARVYGLSEYAAVMSHFAAAERYLNRAWSASVDCYVDEVPMCLDRASDEFGKTQERLKSLRERDP